MEQITTYTLEFCELGLKDIARVGGKNASLGEMFNAFQSEEVRVLDGFATTASAYQTLLQVNGLKERLQQILAGLDPENVTLLEERAKEAREAILETPFPEELRTSIVNAYRRLAMRVGGDPELAVRSSATAEDLPDASFAGQQETYLNVRGEEELLQAVHRCMASLFTDRAINYRARHGFDHMKVALAVGVQPMVRSDKGAAGVIFTLDPESGFRNVVVVTGSYGLGEMVVQGSVTPDEWIVFKPTLRARHRPIIGRTLGSKEVRLIYAESGTGTRKEETPTEQRNRYCLNDDDVLTLARWACIIEEHYSRLAGHHQPMDIEWAKDGVSGNLFIVQARPETVHSARTTSVSLEVYRLTGEPEHTLASGQAVGEKIASGPVRVVRTPSHLEAIRDGDILVAEMTDPDWEPVMRRVAAIVTDSGGRTAHAAIVSRELGLPCIVGTTDATDVLHDGEWVTVCCAEGPEGYVYAGNVPFTIDHIDASDIPATETSIMMNVGDPSQAFSLAAIPNDGIGLARMEFIINQHIGIHPMALIRYPKLADTEAITEIARRIGGEEPREFFIRRLAEGIGRIAAAFYPQPVIVRTSDFKTNEYARLLGGAEFEPSEENPMLGFRGASRYYDPRYQEGFALECAALLRVRRDMGLANVKVMIPFCRTIAEGERVIATMSQYGLTQGEDELEVYAMCELPSNVLSADAFLQIFDGYSIGSNDLTQLTLGIDRDSGTVAHLFDERDQAVLDMIAHAISAAHHAGKPIGICGQAPSDYPEFAEWLVRWGITSISLNPDAVLRTRRIVAGVEATLKHATDSAMKPVAFSSLMEK
jgi:pyruvate,water dikinase